VSGADRVRIVAVLTPIVPGKEADLAEYLETKIPIGPGSPFTSLPHVHFARWVIIGQIRADYSGRRRRQSWLVRPLRMRYLLFSCAFDSSGGDLFDELLDKIGPLADKVWGHCVGYPDRPTRSAFCDYLTHNTLPNVQEFFAYHHSVPEIKQAVRLRQQHVEFALAAQTLTDDALRNKFVQKFGAQGCL
jgi:hypothetical protein